MKNYEIAIEVPKQDRWYILCVDQNRTIRGWYMDGLKHYLSDYELWCNEKGIGKLKGKIGIDEIVWAVKEDGHPLIENGVKVGGVIKHISEIKNLEKILKKVEIVGINVPAIIKESEK